MWTAELRGWLEDEARAVGFDAAGVAEVRGVEDAEVVRGAERFAAWVEAGHAGEMEWLKRRDERGHLRAQCVAGGDAVGAVGGGLCDEL